MARPAAAARATLYLNFAEGAEQLYPGLEDDAANNISRLCQAERLDRWSGAKDCGDRDICKIQIAELVLDYLDAFDVAITVHRPDTPHTMVIIGPESGTCLFDLQGLAHVDCGNRVEGNIGFAFDCSVSSSVCAGVIVHEFAHTLGLDHVDSTSDLMGFGIGEDTSLALRDELNPTLAPTRCGAVEQNSFQAVMNAVGPWPTDDERARDWLPNDQPGTDHQAGCNIGLWRVPEHNGWIATLGLFLLLGYRRRSPNSAVAEDGVRVEC